MSAVDLQAVTEWLALRCWSLWAGFKRYFKNTKDILNLSRHHTVFFPVYAVGCCCFCSDLTRFIVHPAFYLAVQHGGGGWRRMVAVRWRCDGELLWICAGGNRLRLAAHTHARNKPTSLDIHLHNACTANLNSLPRCFSIIRTTPSTFPPAISIFRTLL